MPVQMPSSQSFPTFISFLLIDKPSPKSNPKWGSPILDSGLSINSHRPPPQCNSSLNVLDTSLIDSGSEACPRSGSEPYNTTMQCYCGQNSCNLCNLLLNLELTNTGVNWCKIYLFCVMDEQKQHWLFLGILRFQGIGITCHDDLKLENRKYNLKFISVKNF